MAFSHVCKEKGGTIVRTVRMMPRYRIAHLLEVAEKCQLVANFLPENNPIAPFINPDNLFFEVDDVGIVAAIPENELFTHMHITFWDGRMRGRESLCRTICEWVNTIGGRALFAAIPENRTAVIAFCKRAGFVERGRMSNVVTLSFPNYPE